MTRLFGDFVVPSPVGSVGFNGPTTSVNKANDASPPSRHMLVAYLPTLLD